MRTITIFHSQTTEEQIIENVGDDVTTWGDLRPLIDFDLTNKKAVIEENHTTLEMPDAVLPEGDFTLFLFVSNTKLGAVKDPLANYRGTEGKKNIMAKAVNNLRRDVRKLNGLGLIDINAKGNEKQLRKDLIEAVKNAPVSGSDVKKKAKKTLSQVESDKTKKNSPSKKVAPKKTPIPAKEKVEEVKETAGTMKEEFEESAEVIKEASKKPATSQEITLSLNIDQSEVLEKLDSMNDKLEAGALMEDVSRKLDESIKLLEELPAMIAERMKEASIITKAATELKAKADKIRMALGNSVK